MRPLVISTFVTLDGAMEAPGGEPGHPHTGWVADLQGAEQIAHTFDEVREAGSLLLGASPTSRSPAPGRRTAGPSPTA